MFQVHVHEDGDTEIRQTDNIPSFCDDLFFNTVEEVSAELKSYGHEEDDITRVLDDLSFKPNEWVKI